MGKWATRLAEKTDATFHVCTDKTAKCGLPSVLTVTPGRDADDSHAVQPVIEIRLPPLDLSAVPWTDADIARFLDRRARLLRWGWTEPEAEKLAERLVKRDRDHDDRVSCTDCKHYRPSRCGNHRQADLNMPDVGRDLASMLQRCTGFQPLR